MIEEEFHAAGGIQTMRRSRSAAKARQARMSWAVRSGKYVGLEEIDDGIWNVYFGPLKLGRLHERHMRIEDEYGRLTRHKV